MSETTETPLWEQGESPTDTLDRWIAEGARRTGHINLSRDALKRLRARLTGEAQPSLPAERHGWAIVRGVTCVECPGCAFTFDADHEDDGRDGYSCPSCGFEEAQGAGDEEGWEARWRDLAARLLRRGAGQEHGPERILLMLMAQVEETISAEPLGRRAAPPTAKAPSGPLPAVAIGQNATGTNGAPSGTMFDPAIGGGQSAGVPTPDESATKCPDCGAAHRPSRGCPMIGGSESEGEATDDA